MPNPSRPDQWPKKVSLSADTDSILTEHNIEDWKSAKGDLDLEDCEGPVLDGPMEDVSTEKEKNEKSTVESALCTDRAELIERIKRGESPTWVPSRAVREEYIKENNEPLQRPSSKGPASSSSLLPPAEIESIKRNEAAQEHLHSPYEIERPRSALHAGDFTSSSKHSTGTAGEQPGGEDLGLSLKTPNASSSLQWHTPAETLQYGTKAPWSSSENTLPPRLPTRDRAPSLQSYSSSNYILKKPTTPLVQQSNNTDLDFTTRERSTSPEKGNRRHTLPPHALCDWPSKSSDTVTPSSPPLSYRREASFPHSHHARRSITSTWSLQPSTSPPTPGFLRSRRTSFSSEASPRQNASMVGSYEESILRGRMSTAPSKPFDFSAHIGALGRGKKPKMPAQVVVPFQAVYYDWSLANERGQANAEPSPYVGHIDLQNTDQASNLPLSGSQKDPDFETRPIEPSDMHNSLKLVDALNTSVNGPDNARKRKRSGTKSSIDVPSGAYRIPAQGQIQVVVKNAYKTALKLFIVPYDLTGMEPGQKTFVRQRSYSAGPIIEKPVASPSSSNGAIPTESKKPTLRYLIHLNICCTAKGRFYLYQHIRVVFANRVPDDKEHLTKEIHEPKPKYSPWKATVENLPIGSVSGAKLTAEKAFRRRSSGFNYGESSSDTRRVYSVGGPCAYGDATAPPVPAIPFHLPPPRHPEVHVTDQANDDMDMETSRPTTSSGLSSPLGTFPPFKGDSLQSDDDQAESYAKLNKGETGYGGLFGRPNTPEPGEGLLALRLKGMGQGKDVGRSLTGE